MARNVAYLVAEGHTTSAALADRPFIDAKDMRGPAPRRDGFVNLYLGTGNESGAGVLRLDLAEDTAREIVAALQGALEALKRS